MSNARMWFGQALGWSGVLIAVAVSIPLIALAVVLVRTVLLPVLFLVVLGGAVVYCANNRFRCWTYRVVHGDPHSPMAT